MGCSSNSLLDFNSMMRRGGPRRWLHSLRSSKNVLPHDMACRPFSETRDDYRRYQYCCLSSMAQSLFTLSLFSILSIAPSLLSLSVSCIWIFYVAVVSRLPVIFANPAYNSCLLYSDIEPVFLFTVVPWSIPPPRFSLLHISSTFT